MSNILVDIVDDVQLKPTKMKLLLKWVIGFSTTAIIIAFTFGQIKATRAGRLNNLENTVNANVNAIVQLKTEISDVNLKIDKVYDDTHKAFSDFQDFNNKQLGLFVDYGNTNKELLKNMLELNSMQQLKQLEGDFEQAKQSSLK